MCTHGVEQVVEEPRAFAGEQYPDGAVRLRDREVRGEVGDAHAAVRNDMVRKESARLLADPHGRRHDELGHDGAAGDGSGDGRHRALVGRTPRGTRDAHGQPVVIGAPRAAPPFVVVDEQDGDPGGVRQGARHRSRVLAVADDGLDRDLGERPAGPRVTHEHGEFVCGELGVHDHPFFCRRGSCQPYARTGGVAGGALARSRPSAGSRRHEG